MESLWSKKMGEGDGGREENADKSLNLWRLFAVTFEHLFLSNHKSFNNLSVSHIPDKQGMK